MTKYLAIFLLPIVVVGALVAKQLLPSLGFLQPAPAPASSTAQQSNSTGIVISETPRWTDGASQGEPHVSCQFYVLGTNLPSETGMVSLKNWSDTATLDAPVAATSAYNGAPSGTKTYQVAAGPFTLAPGHYTAFVSASTGNDARHASFWVDPCSSAPASTAVPPSMDTPAPPSTDTPAPGPSSPSNDPTPQPTTPYTAPAYGNVLPGPTDTIGPE